MRYYNKYLLLLAIIFLIGYTIYNANKVKHIFPNTDEVRINYYPQIDGHISLMQPPPSILEEMQRKGEFKPPDFKNIIEEPAPRFGKGAPSSAKFIVIPIEFPESPTNAHNFSNTDLYNVLFATSGKQYAPTMSDYYAEVSMVNGISQFHLEGEVVEWVQSTQPYSYFVNSDGTEGTDDDYGFDINDNSSPYPKNVFGIVMEAVKLADPTIDFGDYDKLDPQDVDSDGNLNEPDGFIDGLFIVHAGPGAEAIGSASGGEEERANHVWSHKCDLTAVDIIYETDDTNSEGEKVKIGIYSMEPETLPDFDTGDMYSGIVTVGVFCHECGHQLGLPDLYDTDYSSSGAGVFGVMASGSWTAAPTVGSRPGDYPADFAAWSRDYLGWTDIETIEEGELNDHLIKPREETGYMVRILKNPDDNDWRRAGGGYGEYFLIENREIVFRSDDDNDGEPDTKRGLIIWHVDESKTSNDDDNHRLSAIMRADGNSSLSSDSGMDEIWTGNDSYDAFNNGSTPNSSFYNGSATGVFVEDIQMMGDNIYADLGVGLVFLGEVYNYPNPFIKSQSRYTYITYIPNDLSEAALTDQSELSITVTIFTLNGELVRVLNGTPNERAREWRMKDGKKEMIWDGETEGGDEIASGQYFYIISTEDDRNKGKITFIH